MKGILVIAAATALLCLCVAAQAITIPDYGPVEPFIGTVYSPYLAPLALSHLNFEAGPGQATYGESFSFKRVSYHIGNPYLAAGWRIPILGTGGLRHPGKEYTEYCSRVRHYP